MTPGRVAFIVLAVVGLLFAVLAGVGLSRDDAGSDPEGRDWLEVFGFGSAPSVEPADLDTGCFDGPARRFEISGNCQVDIGPSDDRARLMELAVPSGAPDVEIRLRPNDSDGVGINEFDLEEGKSISASVGRQGADLRLRCLGVATSCVVNLVP